MIILSSGARALLEVIHVKAINWISQYTSRSKAIKSDISLNKSLGGFHLARQNLMGPTGLGLMRVVIIRRWLATKAILS